MISLPLWALRLVPDAVAGCTGGFLVTAGALGVAVVGTAAAEPRLRPRVLRAGLALVLLGLAWIFRDRLLLLSDSRLWIMAAETMGSHVPRYRAPLGSKLLGVAGLLGSPAVALPLASLVCGGLTAAVLTWGGRARRALAVDAATGDAPAAENPPAARVPRSPSALLILALCLGQPLSFVFYGHVETYPFLAVALALFLACLARDVPHPPSPFTLLAFALLGVIHLLGLLVAGPVLIAGWSGRRRPRIVLLLFAAFLIAVEVAMTVTPGYRPYSLAASGWSATQLVAYAGDVANAWILASIPVILVWPARRRLAADPLGRILALAAATYLVLPFLARFDLGAYRDLDLFTPALVCLTFLAVWGMALGEPVRLRRRLWTLVPSVLVLAAFQTLTRCPAGEAVMERELKHAVMTAGGRSYGYEVLAYVRKDENDLAGAEAMMRRSIETTPGNHRLYGPLGEIQLARGDTAQAIASLERSMSSPRAPLTAPLLGELLTRTGKPERAIALLEPRRASALRSSRGAAALAVAFFHAGLPESTVAVATDRLRVNPTDALAHFNAASGLAALRRYEEATKALHAAIALEPDNVTFHRSLVRVLRRMPNGETRAREYLQSLPPDLARKVAGR